MPKITRDHVKAVSGFVVPLAVSSVISTVVYQNTAPTSTFHHVKLFVGVAALGSMVGDAVTKHVDNKIEEAAEALINAKKALTAQQ